MKRKFWDLESVTIEALKYTTRTIFFKDSIGAYSWAKKNNVLEEVCSHMKLVKSHFNKKRKRIIWDLELVKKEALKHKKRSDFSINSRAAYNWAKKNNVLEEVCSHINISGGKNLKEWTHKLVEKEALKYKTRNKFRDYSYSAYHWSKRNNILEEVCKHMKRKKNMKKRDNIQLDLENVKKEALKYQTRTDFYKGSSKYYNWARKKNILNDICTHMHKRKNVKRDWTIELAKLESSKYRIRTDFYNYSTAAYKWCKENNLLDEVCSHMKKNQNQNKLELNIDMVQEEALKYETRTNFKRYSSKYYNWANTNNLLDNICSHMKKFTVPKKYSLEEIIELIKDVKVYSYFYNHFRPEYNWCRRHKYLNIVSSYMIKEFKELNYNDKYKFVKLKSLKYKNRAQFQINDLNAYIWAIRNKEIDSICSHMEIPPLQKTYSFKKLKKIALKYKTKYDFRKNDILAYNSAFNKNILEEITSHFEEAKYSEKELYEIALKYDTRSELGTGNPIAYRIAYSSNLLDKICSHMTRGISGFNPDKKGFVYYIKIEKDGVIVYKIGITNHNLEKRFGKKQMKYITLVRLWEYENGKEAYNFEQEILKDYAYAKYKGLDILKDGNTEMFIEDVLMLDTQVA